MKTDYSVDDINNCLSHSQTLHSHSLLALTHTSSVFAVRVHEELTSRRMAVKIYNKGEAPPPILSHLLGKSFKHLVAVLRLSTSHPAYLCMELCQQDLKEYSRRGPKGGLCLQEVHRVGCQIIGGMLDLKSIRLMHGDLKPENILVDSSSTIKIADLDFVLREEEFSRKKIRVGTLQYMAPEVLSEWSCSYASDMWSFGVVLFQLYFGHHPFPTIVELDHFKDTSISLAVTIIKDNLQKTRKHVKKCLEQSVQPQQRSLLEVILKCMVWNAACRAQAEQVLELLQLQTQSEGLIGAGEEREGARRKGSWSTECSLVRQEDDIFMFSNSGLLLALEQLHTILSSLPEEANKFKDILAITHTITHPEHGQLQKEELLALRTLIEPKYRKMERNFKRLAHLEGGVGYSNKGQLFIHLNYLIQLLTEPSEESKVWARENSVRSADFLG